MIITPYAYGAGTLWTPNDLSVGPELWLNESSGMTLSGSSVLQWDDISGNARHGTPGSSPTRNVSDLNGKRTVTFDGTNDALTFVTGGANTIFQNTAVGWGLAVVKKTAISGTSVDRCVWAWNCDSTGTAAVKNKRRFSFQLNSTVSSADTPALQGRSLDANGLSSAFGNPALTDTDWHVYMVIWDWANNNGYIYRDGLLETTDTALGTASNTSNTISYAVRLGSIAQTTGDIAFGDFSIAEWIIGSGTAPSAGEIAQLNGYAAWRFGLEGNLPGGHAYETAPPYV